MDKRSAGSSFLREKVKVVVLKLDKDKRKISLGLKQTQPDPWSEVEKRYKVGSRVKGKVTHLTNFGVFVELEKGVEGLIHISDLTWDKYIQHPREILREGEVVEVEILNIEAEKKKISLGLKQTQPDPWEKVLKEYKEGDIISGKVQEITNFGVFVNLIPGIDGFIHISELGKEYISDIKKVVSIGKEIRAKVISIDLEKKRIRLSVKQLELDEEKKRKEEEREKEEVKRPQVEKQKKIARGVRKEEVELKKTEEKKERRTEKREKEEKKEEEFIFLEREGVVIGDFLGKEMRERLKELAK